MYRLDPSIPREQADSIFGRKLDLPTLGVDIPSPDSLEKLLPKGKSKDLKDGVKSAKKKARSLVQKVKGGKQEKEGDTEEPSSSMTEDKKEDEGSAAGEDPAEGDGGEEGGGGDETGASSASSSLRTPYFESTYVDDDLRVGRTGQGDVFVSVRA